MLPNEVVIDIWFENILKDTRSENFEKVSPGSRAQYKVVGKEKFALASDVAIKFDPEYSSYAVEFASDNDAFLGTFASSAGARAAIRITYLLISVVLFKFLRSSGKSLPSV